MFIPEKGSLGKWWDLFLRALGRKEGEKRRAYSHGSEMNFTVRRSMFSKMELLWEELYKVSLLHHTEAED